VQQHDPGCVLLTYPIPHFSFHESDCEGAPIIQTQHLVLYKHDAEPPRVKLGTPARAATPRRAEYVRPAPSGWVRPAALGWGVRPLVVRRPRRHGGAAEAREGPADWADWGLAGRQKETRVRRRAAAGIWWVWRSTPRSGVIWRSPSRSGVIWGSATRPGVVWRSAPRSGVVRRLSPTWAVLVHYNPPWRRFRCKGTDGLWWWW
jgi:hypothetical protein